MNLDAAKQQLEIGDGADRETLVKALRYFRDEKFASLILIAVELVAMSNPDELRHSLMKVFDLKKVEETHDRVVRLNAELYSEIARTRESLAVAREDLAKAIDEVESARFETEQLKATVDGIRRWLRGHVKPLVERNGVYTGEHGESRNRSGESGAGEHDENGAG